MDETLDESLSQRELEELWATDLDNPINRKYRDCIEALDATCVKRPYCIECGEFISDPEHHMGHVVLSYCDTIIH